MGAAGVLWLELLQPPEPKGSSLYGVPKSRNFPRYHPVASGELVLKLRENVWFHYFGKSLRMPLQDTNSVCTSVTIEISDDVKSSKRPQQFKLLFFFESPSVEYRRTLAKASIIHIPHCQYKRRQELSYVFGDFYFFIPFVEFLVKLEKPRMASSFETTLAITFFCSRINVIVEFQKFRKVTEDFTFPFEICLLYTSPSPRD